MNLSVNGILVDIVLIIILMGNSAIGYRKGLIKIAFNLLSSIIAIIFVFVFCKPTTNYIMDHTQIPNSIESAISEKVEIIVQNGVAQAENQIQGQVDKDVQNSADIMNILKIFIGDELGTIMQQASNNIVQTLSHEITYKIISIVVFFGLFAIIRLLLFILRGYMEWVADLPFLDIINSAGGMIYGVISGIFLIYMVLAIISLLMPVYGNTSIVIAIQESILGSRMFNNNILLGMIFKIFN